MNNLDAIRTQWLKERPLYEKFGNYIKNILSVQVRKIGIPVITSHRAKDLDKLLKKALLKNKSYDEITDKVGVRAILHFRKQLPRVDGIIQKLFEIKKREDKLEQLGTDKWGYEGIHYDVCLLEEEVAAFPNFRNLICEIQLQTSCQNIWCDINHELYYKQELVIPPKNIRIINGVSALFEIADLEFERAQEMIMSLPNYKEARLLQILECKYYEFVGREFNRELSIDALAYLCAAYAQLSADNYEKKLEEFTKDNKAMLEQVFQEYTETPERSLFLFQPEGLLILLLLKEDPFRLKTAWARKYPLDELEILANITGTPLPE